MKNANSEFWESRAMSSKVLFCLTKWLSTPRTIIIRVMMWGLHTDEPWWSANGCCCYCCTLHRRDEPPQKDMVLQNSSKRWAVTRVVVVWILISFILLRVSFRNPNQHHKQFCSISWCDDFYVKLQINIHYTSCITNQDQDIRVDHLKVFPKCHN